VFNLGINLAILGRKAGSAV